MTWDSKTYKSELCEKSCKSDSSLNKHKVKVHKLNKDDHLTTSIISKCLEDKELLSNTLDTKIKKRKQISEEKIQLDNEALNHKRKSICDDIDTKVIYNNKIYNCEYCEKSCKSNSSLDKHKAKAHKLNKDGDFTKSNISKCSNDEVCTLLSNVIDEKIKKRKKASKEKIEVDNETLNHKRKSICDDIDTKVIYNNKIYNCEYCEKSCKSNSSLDKHKAKAHKLNKDGDFTNISKCSNDEVCTFSNVIDEKIKKRKKASKEKIQLDNQALNHKRKSICDDIDAMVIHNNKIYNCEYCEKSCKSNSSLDKHKAKAHKSEKDGDFTKSNISKCSNDEVCTLLSNVIDEKIKKRKKASKEKIEVDNETLNHKRKSICDDIDTKVIYNNKIYNCEYCEKSCKSNSSLDKHKAKVHKLEKEAATISTMDNSKSLENNEELLLKKSTKMTKKRKKDNKMNISLMIDEVKTMESPKGDELMSKSINEHQTGSANWTPYFCRFCKQRFKLLSSLSVHEASHTSNKSSLECNVCSKMFPNLNLLYSHCASMHSHRPFKCNVCESAFTRNSHLIVHYRKHTGERPFTCDVCSSAFMRKSDLNIHYRKHTGHRPFTCKVCDSTFSSSANRTVHMRTHSGHRPYVCNICGRSFNQSHVLTEHMRSHTGDKPYECGICEMSFVSSGGLRKHTQRKHNSRH